MKKEQLKAMAESLSYAYRKGFIDAIQIFGVAIEEYEINEVISEAKDKATKELVDKFSDEINN